MKTSPADIIQAERFLQGELPDEDRLLFEAKLLVDDRLRVNVFFHRLVHRLVRLYHRKKVKAQIEELQARLFSDPLNTELIESARLFKS